jgi:heme/copper-type cytochrome/quinol oxidase subunit 2
LLPARAAATSGVGMAASHKRAGGMDISQAQQMWGTFSRMMVVGISLVVVILALMAIFLV